MQNGVKSFKSIHLSVILLWSIKNGRQTFSIQEVFFVSSCQLFSLVLNYSYSGDVFRYLGRKLKSFLFITLFCAHEVSLGYVGRTQAETCYISKTTSVRKITSLRCWPFSNSQIWSCYQKFIEIFLSIFSSDCSSSFELQFLVLLMYVAFLHLRFL